MSNKPSRESKSPAAQDVSIDALLDDLFGLNWRAIKTLGISFSHPRRYAESAWSADWNGRFTASFRLWFTLVAILFFFQFFWASADGALIKMYTMQLESSGVELPEGVTTHEASQYFARINFSLLPFASAFCLFAFGYMFRAWGERVPFVVRVRYVFAIVIPGTALALPLFWLLGIAHSEQAVKYLTLTWLIPVPIDFWISYRGVFAHLSGSKRFFRALFFAACSFLAMVASALLSSFLAGAWITWTQSG